MNPDGISIAITTLGCKVNQCDSAALQESLQQHGYRIVAFGSAADISIVNTCVVTARTEAQSRQLIRRALRSSAAGRVLVTGCYANRSAGQLTDISERVHVIGNAEKSHIVGYVDALITSTARLVAVADIAQESAVSTPAVTRFFDRTRAFLKIQDGCNSRCAYCIVPSVRGRSRSLPQEAAMQRLEQLVAAGYREIVLTGIHLGAYGLDRDPPGTLLDLLVQLEARSSADGLRLRLSSLEPKELTDELIDHIGSSSMICPHVHVPLQSGDDDILRRMRRPYTADFFAGRIDRLTAAVPGVTIGVDVIAGFPGESAEQFDRTLDLLQQLPVGYLHAFPFSRRPGTEACGLDGQVAEAVKKERVRRLRSCSDDKKRSRYARSVGTFAQVLVEHRRDRHSGLLQGFSRSYLPLLLEGPDALMGSEVTVAVRELRQDRLYGIIKAEPAGDGYP